MHARLLSHEGPRDKAISVHGSFTHLRRWSRLSHVPRATWPRCSRCIVDRGGSVTRHAGGCSPPLLAPRQPSPRHPGFARNLDRPPHYVIPPPHETQTSPACMALSPNETQTTPATPQAPISADLPEAWVVPVSPNLPQPKAGVVAVSPSHTQPMAGVVPVSRRPIQPSSALPRLREPTRTTNVSTHGNGARKHTTTAFNTRLSLADSRSCGRGESPPHTRNPGARRARGEKPSSSPNETQLSPHDAASSKRPAYPALNNAVKTGERAPMARPQTHTPITPRIDPTTRKRTRAHPPVRGRPCKQYEPSVPRGGSDRVRRRGLGPQAARVQEVA